MRTPLPMLILILVATPACWRATADQPTDGGADAAGDADTDTDSDADTDTDSDADGDGDTDLDTETCTEGVWEGDFQVVNTDSIWYELIGFTAVTGELLIDDTWLYELSGLECLQSVGSLRVLNNDDLFVLDGLDNVAQVDGELFVVNNGDLENLSGLGSLITVGGVLEVASNPSMSNLAGAELLTTVGSLMVIGNDGMASLDGLVNLSAIGESLLVASNPNLPYCEICDLLDQLYVEPATVTCSDNDADSCWTGAELSCPP